MLAIVLVATAEVVVVVVVVVVAAVGVIVVAAAAETVANVAAVVVVVVVVAVVTVAVVMDVAASGMPVLTVAIVDAVDDDVETTLSTLLWLSLRSGGGNHFLPPKPRLLFPGELVLAEPLPSLPMISASSEGVRLGGNGDAAVPTIMAASCC